MIEVAYWDPCNWLRSVWIGLILLKLKTYCWNHYSKIIFKCVNSAMGPIFNEKIDKKWNLWVRKQCTDALFTENWSKVAATVYVPYMNSSRKWGENAWKKKRKKKKRKTQKLKRSKRQSKHTLKQQSHVEHSTVALDRPIWNKLWSLNVPPKVKTFIWWACSNSLPTRDNLHGRKMQVEPRCGFCYQRSKTAEHVLWTCPFARNV